MILTTATPGPTPTGEPPSSVPLAGSHCNRETHSSNALGHLLAIDQRPDDTHVGAVDGEHSAGSHHRSDNQCGTAAGTLSPSTNGTPTPSTVPSMANPRISHRERTTTMNHTDPAPSQSVSDTQQRSARGDLLAIDYRCSDTQGHSVDGEHPAGSHRATETQVVNAAGTLSDDGHRTADTHVRPAVVGPSNPSSDDGQARADTQKKSAVVGPSSTHPTIDASTPKMGASDGWLELRVWAEMWTDAQQSRIAATNRAERGGVDPDIYAGYLAALNRTEHQCLLALRRCYRKTVPQPIQEWQKMTNGVGIDRLAKILGHLGHPVWATPHHWEGSGSNRVLITDPPFERTVGQLWQYCGHGAPGRAKKGASADELAALGNPRLKSLVWNAANECMKCMTSPYRLVYERVRQELDPGAHSGYETHGPPGAGVKTHTAECVRCGPSGKPAQPGSPWSPGHQHAHALRIVGKELLRDLWTVAR